MHQSLISGYASAWRVPEAVGSDSHLVHDSLGLYMVADGRGDDLSSTLAVDIIHDFFERLGPNVTHTEIVPGGRTYAEELMDMAYRLADREVVNERPDSVVGCSLASVLIRGSYALISNVGDTRVYRMAGTGFELLTRPEVARPFTAGLVAQEGRLIGQSGVAPQQLLMEVAPGDRFLLCTAPLTDALTSIDLAALLLDSLPFEASRGLVEEARRLARPERVTALVVDLS